MFTLPEYDGFGHAIVQICTLRINSGVTAEPVCERVGVVASADDGQTFAAPEECLQCYCAYTWLCGTERDLETMTGRRHTKSNIPEGVAHTLTLPTLVEALITSPSLLVRLSSLRVVPPSAAMLG